MKALIYARVSSKEQEETGYSLDAQINLIQDYAKNRKLEVDKIFRISESASGRHIRKTFNEMLIYASKKNIKVILCEKIDRLTRNLKDAALIQDWIYEDSNREINFVKENFILNQNTKAHESLVWDMKVAMARFYTNNLSEEVKKGQAQKIREGGYPSRALLGYRTIGDKGRKTHVINNEVAPFIRKLFELYANGLHSIKTVTDFLYNQGLRNFSGKKVHKSMIANILGNPFYYGAIPWKGVVTLGNHEPIISKDLYDRVQVILRSKNTPKHRKHSYLYQQMGKCEKCGGTLTGETQKGHIYYHCNGYKGCKDRKYIREEVITDKIENLFGYLIEGIDDEELNLIRDILHENHGDEIAYFNSSVQSLDNQYTRLQQRIDGAYTDKLDGRISSEQWEKYSKDWREEQKSILDTKHRLQENSAQYMILGISFLDLATRAKEIYVGVGNDVERKREFLKITLSNFTLNGDKIQLFFTKPLLKIQKRLDEIKMNHSTFEPSKSLDNKSKTGLADPVLSTVLRSQDSNLEPSR